MSDWVYNDGGRADAGFKGKGNARDCVTRAIAIVGGVDYREVYDELFGRYKQWLATSRTKAAQRLRAKGRNGSPREGVQKEVWKQYLKDHGWRNEALVNFGSSSRVHLDAAELPPGTYIAQCSRHLVAIVDGVINDTFDPSREGNRTVYSVWYPPTEE